MDYPEVTAWQEAHEEDLWIFDKLILSRKLGYLCGPSGIDVPKPGNYIVRPCVNICGMGKGAEFHYIKDDTDYLPPGFFWCEIFQGRHVSVDYKNGKQILAVEGFRNSSELWRFNKWEKINEYFPLPDLFLPLIKKYEYLNIEYIGNKVIEIHLRYNPNFKQVKSVAYPVWNDQEQSEFEFAKQQGLKYIESPNFKRVGFYID